MAGGVAIPATAAGYFAYDKWKTEGFKPVKAALIGAGDEGGVLVGEHNPDLSCSSSPSATSGPATANASSTAIPSLPPRKGFKKIYGKDCDKDIKQYDDYDKFLRELRENKDIEAVVIALPLSWHARAAIDCMSVGKERGKPVHVLCEKLMAWNIGQCKKMIEVAKDRPAASCRSAISGTTACSTPTPPR